MTYTVYLGGNKTFRWGEGQKTCGRGSVCRRVWSWCGLFDSCSLALMTSQSFAFCGFWSAISNWPDNLLWDTVFRNMFLATLSCQWIVLWFVSLPTYIWPYFTCWISYETIEVLQTINTETEHVPWDDVSEVDKRWQRTCSCDRSPPPRQHPPPSPALPVPMRPTPVLWHWSSRKPSTGEHR